MRRAAEGTGMDVQTLKPLERISRTTLVDDVIAAIRVMLDANGWAPGTRLPSEHQLSLQLGVGRSTVREALRVLGHLGLVQSRSGRGTFVLGRDLADPSAAPDQAAQGLSHLFDFRRAVEPLAARLAAERRTADALRAIKAAWSACSDGAQNNSIESFTALDYAFHLSIFEAGGNPFLIEAYRAIRPAFITYVGLVLGLGPLTRMTHFHDKLIEAISRQDPQAALRAVEENFVDTDVRQRMILAQTSPGAA